MKYRIWKEEQHRELRRRTEEFLARGGEVRQVPPGISGLEEGHPVPAFRTYSPARIPRRTPLTDVVAAIELRKRAASTRRRRTAAPSRGPRRKLLYDDFGEPLRWVWVDE